MKTLLTFDIDTSLLFRYDWFIAWKNALDNQWWGEFRPLRSVSTKPPTARSNDDHLKWRGRESGTVRRRAKSCNDSLWQGSPSEGTLHLSMSQWRERTATITLHVRLAREAEREMERTFPESTGMFLHMTDAARSHAKMCQLPRNQLHHVKSSHL